MFAVNAGTKFAPAKTSALSGLDVVGHKYLLGCVPT